jgi:hypothetical protein
MSGATAAWKEGGADELSATAGIIATEALGELAPSIRTCSAFT